MNTPKTPISKVHLIFKTHLDVGYTDFAQAVVQHYYTHFIPQALDLAEKLRQLGGSERFIWTTGSWLIYTYLEQASSTERKRMEDAILAGDIAWHGLPFTSYSEMMDESLYRHGLSLSQRLDQRFGRQTIAAKMTDVPGHTRAIVPLLAEAGIQFLHIGVNAASCPPDVPPVCVWRDPCGAEVILMYHKGSYGAGMALPGLGEAIQFAFTNDNEGPQTPEAVQAIFHETRQHYPGAEVTASTLDAFARALLPVKATLPVVTAEIGDSWIHGVGTDPKKVARFRTLQRLRRDWLASETANLSEPRMFAFSQGLLAVAEHTWGLDIKVHLADFETYASAAVRAARSQENYHKVEASWAEQRLYLDQALAALEGSHQAVEARAALQELEPQPSDLRGYLQVHDLNEALETPHFSVHFDERGAITTLQERTSGLRWAGTQQPLGLVVYETFSQVDYDRYYRQYIQNKRHTWFWAIPDFTKPGMAEAGSEHQEWTPTLQALWQRQEAKGHSFLLEMAFPETAVHNYGCPRRVNSEVFFPADETAIYLTLQWFQKEACRLPEALWLSFCPRTTQPEGWKVEKMGQLISPLEVVRNGNRHLHAIDRGVVYDDGSRRFALESLDAPLVAPGKRSLLNFNQRQIDPSQGMHFNLLNNIWGTNHPMWYDEDAKFRFVLRF